jgi:hypothetical protein
MNIEHELPHEVNRKPTVHVYVWLLKVAENNVEDCAYILLFID